MFNAVQTLLESNTITKEVAEALDSEIGGELKKLRDESATLRIQNKELTSTFEEVMQSKTSMESKLADYDEKIKTARDEGKGEIVKELEAERQKHNDLIGNLQKFEKENTRLKIENAVSGELGKYNIRKDLRGDAATVLQSMTSFGENGVVFGDGLTLEDGVKDYFSKRASYLDPVGDSNGSDAQNKGGNGGGVDYSKLSPSEKMKQGRK